MERQPDHEGKKMTRLAIMLRRSTIGHTAQQKRVALGLGLRKMNRVVIRENSPQIRGMVHKISHLLSVKEID